MKKILISFIMIVSLGLSNTVYASEGACLDSKYVELKSKNLESLSERQFEVYKRLDSACSLDKNSSSTLGSIGTGVAVYFGAMTLLVLLIL